MKEVIGDFMSPHTVYTQEYVDHMLRDLLTDKEFLIQSMHSIYDKASLKDKTDLQWAVVAFVNSMDETISKLKAVDNQLAKINKKGEDAGTKV